MYDTPLRRQDTADRAAVDLDADEPRRRPAARSGAEPQSACARPSMEVGAEVSCEPRRRLRIGRTCRRATTHSSTCSWLSSDRRSRRPRGRRGRRAASSCCQSSPRRSAARRPRGSRRTPRPPGSRYAPTSGPRACGAARRPIRLRPREWTSDNLNLTATNGRGVEEISRERRGRRTSRLAARHHQASVTRKRRCRGTLSSRPTAQLQFFSALCHTDAQRFSLHA